MNDPDIRPEPNQDQTEHKTKTRRPKMIWGTIRFTNIRVFWLGTGEGFATLEDLVKLELTPKVYRQPRSAAIANTRLRKGSFAQLVSGLECVDYKDPNAQPLEDAPENKAAS